MQAIIRLAYGRVFIIKDGVLWQRVYRVEGVPLAAIPMCLRGKKNETKEKQAFILLFSINLSDHCGSLRQRNGPQRKEMDAGKVWDTRAHGGRSKRQWDLVIRVPQQPATFARYSCFMPISFKFHVRLYNCPQLCMCLPVPMWPLD